MLRVASAASRARHIAAIWAFNALIGVPARSRLATIEP
jgi:hypothetical protein